MLRLLQNWIKLYQHDRLILVHYLFIKFFPTDNDRNVADLIVLQALERRLLVPQTAVSLQNLSKWTGCNYFLHTYRAEQKRNCNRYDPGTLKVRTASPQLPVWNLDLFFFKIVLMDPTGPTPDSSTDACVSCRWSLQPSKFITKKFLFLPSCIRIQGPHWIWIQSGSGSTTLRRYNTRTSTDSNKL